MLSYSLRRKKNTVSFIKWEHMGKNFTLCATLDEVKPLRSQLFFGIVKLVNFCVLGEFVVVLCGSSSAQDHKSSTIKTGHCFFYSWTRGFLLGRSILGPNWSILLLSVALSLYRIGPLTVYCRSMTI